MERLHVNYVRDIIHRMRMGQSNRAIARDMGIARLTVRRYRRLAGEKGLLEACRPLPEAGELLALLGPVPKPPVKESSLLPYKEVVETMLEQGLEMMVIYERLRDSFAYAGSYSSVRRFVSKLRPKQVPAYVRLHSAPGEEAQVDFGSAGRIRDMSGVYRQGYIYVMTLCYSRHQYSELVFDQKLPTWIALHRRAFESFGGTPRKVVLDNIKAAVLEAALHDPVLSEPYRRLAVHYGFLVSPNRPGTPRHKGKVESGIRYVERNFLAGQDFADIQEGNRQLALWVKDKAGTRLHGTTHRQPLEMFQSEEKEQLLPLPEAPFSLLEVRLPKVHSDCHVELDGNHYSLPYRYNGTQVEAYIYENLVQFYLGTELICSHPRLSGRGKWSTRLADYPKEKAAYLEKTPSCCRELAKAVGEATSEVVEQLLSERPADRLRSVQALLRLSDKVGQARLESACRRALYFGDPRYRRIKDILAAQLDQEPLPEAAQGVPPQERPLSAFAFQRPTTEFFPLEERLC